MEDGNIDAVIIYTHANPDLLQVDTIKNTITILITI